MKIYSRLSEDMIYEVQYINNEGKAFTTTLITNLLCGINVSEMKEDLSWLLGREVIGYKLI